MKLQTQFTVPKKEIGDLNYMKQMNALEKRIKKDHIDYRSKENCLFCCN